MSPRPTQSLNETDAGSGAGAETHEETERTKSAPDERTDDWTDLAKPAAKEKPSTEQRPPNSLADSDDRREGQRREGQIAVRSKSPLADTPRENEHSQSLRSKLVLALAFMLALVVGIDEMVRQKVIAPEFAAIERKGAIKDTNRVISAINTEIEFLAELAAMGALHLRTASHSSPIVDRCLPATGDHQRADWTATLDSAGHWQRITVGGVPHHIENKSIPLAQLKDHLLLAESTDSGRVLGSVLDGNGQLHLIASVPAFRNETRVTADSGVASAGLAEVFGRPELFVIGKRFDQSMISELRQRTRVGFDVLFDVENTNQDRADEERQGNREKHELTIHTVDQSELITQTPVIGINGKPIADLCVKVPRDVTSRSKQTNAFARALSLIGISISLILLLFLLQRIVVGRLKSIREQTERIALTGLLSEDSETSTLVVSGDDEIGQLARSFDRMRSRLGEAQRRLSDSSHAAGMSVVADTVIHNVGNVLTNVNSLIKTASERVQQLRIEPLEKLAGRLREQDADQDLFRATPDYLHRLSQILEDDKDELAELLKTLNENVQHIHQVIREQSRHTQQTLEWSNIPINDMVGEAIRCCRARLQQDHVRVHFDNSSDAVIRTDRSLLLQILINIISNAGNAMRGIRGRQPELRIDLIRTVSTIHLRFRDNGCGMNTEVLSRIFDAHFTTRETGSGLGLHFCAIAMKRVGGSIHVESEGPDRGATFTLEIPLDDRSTATADETNERHTMRI